MADVYTGLMQAVGASEKVIEIIDRRPKILNDGTLKPPTINGKIQFRDVTFEYPSRPDSPVLKVWYLAPEFMFKSASPVIS